MSGPGIPAFTPSQETALRRIVREEVAAIESERFKRTFTNIDEMVADYAATSLVMGDQTAPQARQEPPEAGDRHDR